MLHPASLRHLRIEEILRYFKIEHCASGGARAGDFVQHRHCASKDKRVDKKNRPHPQHDERSSRMECGAVVKYDKGSLAAIGRSKAQLGCVRSLNVEPTSSTFKETGRAQRDVFYEIRLYCFSSQTASNACCRLQQECLQEPLDTTPQ